MLKGKSLCFSTDDEARSAAVRRTMATIEHARRLGALAVVLHWGRVDMASLTDDWIRLARDDDSTVKERKAFFEVQQKRRTEKQMEISLYQIDAFASKLFEGNPAAVCPLTEWLPDGIMQSIAAENNLSETAFFVPKGAGYHIRWFTPVSEVDLCGHATLASAYVLFHILGYKKDKIEFDSKSGRLSVTRDNEWLVMDFPVQPPVPCDIPDEIVAAFDKMPMECLKAEDFIVVFNHEKDIESANPDLRQLAKLDLRGVIITAKSTRYDFVSRFFAPKYGVPEDPVTGSAYTQLAPYWASKTGSNRFRAKQLSSRGGELICELAGGRVLIYGKAVKYLEGRIHIRI